VAGSIYFVVLALSGLNTFITAVDPRHRNAAC